MASVKPPKHVRAVLVALQGRGYPAYLAGGCVRDMLLGVRAQSWDICTGAQPEQIAEVFPDACRPGARSGVVTVLIDSHEVSVTSFRSSSPEPGSGEPDLVRFIGDLTADLSRRDFTMNAIALSADGMLADPFGGVEDIRRQLIRCVGVPEERFAEDPLRMFRALRYSARLGFTVDLFTMEGIRARAPLAAELPAESVRDELEKTLLTRSPETVYSLVELGLLTAYLLPAPPDPVLLHRLALLPRRAQYRWAGLCHVLLTAGSISSPERFLSLLKLDHHTIRMAEDCCEMLASELPQNDLNKKRWLRRYGVETVRCALSCRDAFTGGQESLELRRILKSGECFSLKHLAVSGSDLLALGLHGRAAGEMLDFLLEYVMEYPGNNRRELLLSLAAGTEE